MAGTLVPSITVVTCYGMWLVRGCSPFMPFISDLGMHGGMRFLFCGGLAVTAVFQANTNIDVWYVRCCSIQCTRNKTLLQMINCLSAMTGLVIALGIACLGFFPWDIALGPHLLCARAIFFGGTGWACYNLAWQWKMLRLSKARKCVQFASVVLSVTSLVLMTYYIVLAREKGVNIAILLDKAYSNFDVYCRDKHFDELSMAAVFEWLLISSLVGSVTTLQADFNLYFGASTTTMPLDDSLSVTLTNHAG